VRSIFIGLPRFGDAGDQVGIRIGDRPGRDRGDILGEDGDAGMRIAVVVRTRRADDDGRSALLRGDRGTAAAHVAVRAVSRTVLRRAHGVVHEGDLALERPFRCSLEGIERREIDHLGLDALGGCRRREAERGDRQRLRVRRGQLRPFFAALPGERLERLDLHILEAQCIELGLGPEAGLAFFGRSGKARTDLGGQAFDDLPGDARTFGRRGLCGSRQKRDGGEERRGGEKRRAGESALHDRCLTRPVAPANRPVPLPRD
jgi:hypothetical protein